LKDGKTFINLSGELRTIYGRVKMLGEGEGERVREGDSSIVTDVDEDGEGDGVSSSRDGDGDGVSSINDIVCSIEKIDDVSISSQLNLSTNMKPGLHTQVKLPILLIHI
jgi:hypothetical protein